ncbi:hypothetical protein M432DRAFT_396448 [Thermoascus aurantiacus ATCC 26904]
MPRRSTYEYCAKQMLHRSRFEYGKPSRAGAAHRHYFTRINEDTRQREGRARRVRRRAEAAERRRWGTACGRHTGAGRTPSARGGAKRAIRRRCGAERLNGTTQPSGVACQAPRVKTRSEIRMLKEKRGERWARTARARRWNPQQERSKESGRRGGGREKKRAGGRERRWTTFQSFLLPHGPVRVVLAPSHGLRTDLSARLRRTSRAIVLFSDALRSPVTSPAAAGHRRDHVVPRRPGPSSRPSRCHHLAGRALLFFPFVPR